MAFNAVTTGFGGAAAPAVTGFGAKAPAAAGFGAPAAPAAGGFGATSTGFGGAAAPVTGFGAKAPTATGFGVPAAPAVTGFGAKAPAAAGFGAPAAPAAGGFGATSTGFGGAAAPVTGFGAKAPTATGFGVPAAPAVTGFGAKAPGGFGGGGFGSGFGGTGMGLGGGVGMGMGAAGAPNAPYPGIKGPGNSSSWVKDVDFSQINDNTLFESLPVPLQQHLIELRTFMNTERAALKSISAYLNETDPKIGEAVSYSNLLRRTADLKGGDRAVDVVAVTCTGREREVQRFSQMLDSLEQSVKDYERDVWEPLVEHGGLPIGINGKAVQQGRTTTSTVGAASRSGVVNNTVTSDSTPLFSLLEELSRNLERISGQIEELEVALVPTPQQSHSASGAAAAAINTTAGAASAAAAAMSRGRTNAGRANGALEESASRMPYSTRAAAAAAAVVGGAGRADGGKGVYSGVIGASAAQGTSAVAQNPVAQVNAAFTNELSTLTTLSYWAARLHARSTTARELFTQLYGQTEADVLFAPEAAQLTYQNTIGAALSASRRLGSNSVLSLGQLPQAQYTPSAMMMQQPTAQPQMQQRPLGAGGLTGGLPVSFGATPAATTITAPAGSMLGAGGLGAAPVAAPSTTSVAPSFGAAAPSTTPAAVPAATGTGFGGFGASTTAPAAGAPATGGFGAAANSAASPSGPRASTAGAPTVGVPPAFNLGPSAAVATAK